MKNIQRVLQLSSNVRSGCDRCGESLGSSDGHLQNVINHYIGGHGYQTLHVGTESELGSDGKQWNHTIAMLGHEKPPPVRTISVGTVVDWVKEEDAEK